MMKRDVFIKFCTTAKFEELDYTLKSTVREAVVRTLEHEGFAYDASISVTFCDNAYIKELNSRYRGVDKHTDVLSFPMYEDGNFDISECISGAVLGDIVISVERAKEQAKELGNSFLREVAFLTIHSTLHLLGYDHEKGDEEDAEQCRIQKEIISGMEI